jgi:hypothetical protein
MVLLAISIERECCVPTAQDQSESFGRFEMGFCLGEALEALESVLKELAGGLYREASDEMALLNDLSFVVNKLCLAWHRRNSVIEDINRRSQGDYEAMTSKIPNWGGHFEMVEAGVAHDDIAPFVRRRMLLDAQTIHKYLWSAEVALRDLIESIEAGTVNLAESDSLANHFKRILLNLCLAWHLRCMAPAEVSALGPTTLSELAHWIPPWQWMNIRLIPQDASPIAMDEEKRSDEEKGSGIID